MKLQVAPGSTDLSLLLFIPDTSSLVGEGLTGLAYNTGFTAYYVRPGSTALPITLVNQTVTGAHTDGGFVEISATNMPGIYRFDVPDLILAAGVRSVAVMLKGADNMPPIPLEIDLAAEVDATRISDEAATLLNLLVTAVKLAEDGLDAISNELPADPDDYENWNWREGFNWWKQRFVRSSKSLSAFLVRSNNGAPFTTQEVTDNGSGNETLGPPSQAS